MADPDAVFMRRALDLAARGLGRTSPNPAVGAVVVVQGEIVGEGWHERAGCPHAEVVALAAAGPRARDATLYVTLEPCCHFGRTPPCTDAILAAGPRRVVYACPDCDERCAGQGAAALAARGLEVVCGPLGDEALRLNEAYFKHKRTGLPFVTLKLACSLDGKTATRTGESRWISGEQSRALVHELRDRSDAVMVGIGTVLRDDPRLDTRRVGGGGRNALRVVVDSRARTPLAARVLSAGSPGGCVIAVCHDAPPGRTAALRAAGAEVLSLPCAAPPQTGVDLAALMAELGRRAVMSVLLEGGATLAAGAVRAGVVDKVLLFVAPKLIGGAEAPGALGDLGVEALASAPALRFSRLERVGEDVLLEAYL